LPKFGKAVPTFILAVAGPWFCVLGGVYLSQVVIQPLTDFVFLAINPRDYTRLIWIARLFRALQLALRQLKDFYETVVLERSEHRFFPYARQYRTKDNATVDFTYVESMTEEPTRLVWKATTDDGRTVVVKFVWKYNVAAHHLCAENDFAPELLYSSGKNLELGGFQMIVMDYVNGTPLDMDLTANETDRKAIFDSVESAINLLHEKGLVFADLRTPNILAVETNGQQHAMLIDFDWCGEHQVDVYPPSMNQSLPWPAGASPGSPLDKAHDHHWLKELRRYLCLK
jgi:serine/threonine protein kinase